MGKKKVAAQTTEAALKEKAAVEDAFVKSVGKASTKRFEVGRVYVVASYNNTLISITGTGFKDVFEKMRNWFKGNF